MIVLKVLFNGNFTNGLLATRTIAPGLIAAPPANPTHLEISGIDCRVERVTWVPESGITYIRATSEEFIEAAEVAGLRACLNDNGWMIETPEF